MRVPSLQIDLSFFDRRLRHLYSSLSQTAPTLRPSLPARLPRPLDLSNRHAVYVHDRSDLRVRKSETTSEMWFVRCEGGRE